MVWRERAGADDGLTLWYAFSLAPDQNQALFPFFAGTGAGWQGALPGRDNDWILFGSYYGSVSRDFAAAEQNTGLGNPTYEWVLEWDYRAQLTPWLYVMPTIQWIIRPRAFAIIPAALVLGAEIGVTF
jgi:carbohydrate-selective porin OprB